MVGTLIVLFTLHLDSITVEAKGSEVYIAIGDSLAAGQTPNRAIDAGYTDLIAQELTTNGPASFLFKSISISRVYNCRCIMQLFRQKKQKNY